MYIYIYIYIYIHIMYTVPHGARYLPEGLKGLPVGQAPRCRPDPPSAERVGGIL